METQKIQEDTIKISDQISLVKFDEKFVEKYHEWMQDEDLCALVDTEPLNLEQVKKAQEFATDPTSTCKRIFIL